MSLEERITNLADLEAIKFLKTRYAQVLDGFSEEKISNLFTEDAVWDIGKRGSYKGRKEIQDFFDNKLSSFQPFSMHYFVQPVIEIDGTKATGRWYMLLAACSSDGSAVWSAGIEDDEYEKVDGEWLMSRMKLTSVFRTPYELGWAKKRFEDSPS